MRVLTDVVTEPDDADVAGADEEVRPEELAEAAFGASERQRRVKVERRRPVHVSASEGSVRLWADAAHLEPSNVQRSAQEEAVTDVVRLLRVHRLHVTTEERALQRDIQRQR